MYFNRELSWLKFNERVLGQAEDDSLPLLERTKFSAIFSSNLDEFFMIRVASVKDEMNLGINETDESGYTPDQVFEEIHTRVSTLVKRQSEISEDLLRKLEEKSIVFIRRNSYDEAILDELQTMFQVDIFPVLTPMAVDFSRPFPLISNHSLYIAVKLLVRDVERLALVEVPRVLERIIPFRSGKNKHSYLMLEDIIEAFIGKLFAGNEVLSTCQFRITRNGDLNLLQEETDALLNVIEEAVKLRKWGEAIRLELSSDADIWFENTLTAAFHMESRQVYRVSGFMDKTFWFKFKAPKNITGLSKQAYIPKKTPLIEKKNIFKAIKEEDIFLHHPYESFDLVVDLIRQASQDPHVLAIKQTLYRVSGNSEIVKALAEAAEKGKQVTVLLELMARFDEEKNINWAKQLEQKGAHVIYGLLGLKTHSKITLIVRQEKHRIRRYVHLGTGNYNDQTAKLYTDMSLITAKESYGSEASMFFNMISGFADEINTHVMRVSPYNLRSSIYDLIDHEIKVAKSGREARITAKLNSLADKGIIEKLYDASKAGVKIDLIVRGICCLVPGVKGLSENIRVISIIGEFLEHSRIYTFYNEGHQKVFLSSADWMTRNLSRRIELMFPIEEEIMKKRILFILELYLNDNQKAWKLKSDGTYGRVIDNSGKNISAQDILKTMQYNDNNEFINKLTERM